MIKKILAGVFVIFSLFFNILVVNAVEINVDSVGAVIGEASYTVDEKQFTSETGEDGAPAATEKKAVLRSRYRTGYNAGYEARSSNIDRACRAINGLYLKPGREISFNGVTGERTEENGYKIARVIEDGRYVSGVGGGVCQVSTTLYNALMLAGVEVTEVHSHTIRPDYVPLSRDAMVSYGISDLKFVNNTEGDLIVYATAKNGDLTVDIYGNPTDVKIELESCLVEELPPDKPEIIYDNQGEYQDKVIFKSESFVLVKEKAGAVSKLFVNEIINGVKTVKQVREDYYSPVRGAIVYGTL